MLAVTDRERLAAIPDGRQIMLKLALRTGDDCYARLIMHANVPSVVAPANRRTVRHLRCLDDRTEPRADRHGRASPRSIARYGGDVDLPAYNFTATDLGERRADRDPANSFLF